MAFTQACFIRKNNPELRKKLEELGHTICKCCEFEGADWLDIITHKDASYTVHGVGYDGEFDTIYGTLTQQERFNEFLKTTKSIDCGENEELFLALAALRDDTNENQWFITQNTMWDEDYNGEITVYYEEGEWLIWGYYSFMETRPSDFRKATAKEIIEHFKK